MTENNPVKTEYSYKSKRFSIISFKTCTHFNCPTRRSSTVFVLLFLWFLFCFKYKFVCYVSLHFSSLKTVLCFFVTLFICFEDQKEGLKCPPLTGLLKGYLVKLPSNRNELSVEQIINKLIFFSSPEICQFES